VLTVDVLDDFVTGPARDERGDAYVCVKEQLHQTRENTSSSV
jgi:hypothetical protein